MYCNRQTVNALLLIFYCKTLNTAQIRQSNLHRINNNKIRPENKHKQIITWKGKKEKRTRVNIFATTYFPTGLAICPPYLAQPATLLTTNGFNPSLVPQPNLIRTQNSLNTNQHYPYHNFYPSSSLLSTPNSINYHQHHHHHHQRHQLHSSNTTNIQINQSNQSHLQRPTNTSAASAAVVATSASSAVIPLCYCAHCCPPAASVVSALTPTAVILSQYMEINLCDTFSLGNQTASTATAATLATASINNCSSVAYTNTSDNNTEHNTIINGTIITTGTSNNINNNTNSNNPSDGHTAPFNCKEIMVSAIYHNNFISQIIIMIYSARIMKRSALKIKQLNSVWD